MSSNENDEMFDENGDAMNAAALDDQNDSAGDGAQAAGNETETERQSKFFQENGFERRMFFQTPDGQQFATQAEAAEHVRGYLAREQLEKLVAAEQIWDGVKPELVAWLYERRQEIVAAYDAAKPRTRAPMTDAARQQVAARLAVAREKGSVQALLESEDTPEEMKEGLRTRLKHINEKLAALSPAKKQEQANKRA